MAQINPKLLERLTQRLGIGQSQVYKLIDATVRRTHLPRDLAAIVLASERGINISRFATRDQLAAIRAVGAGGIGPAPHAASDSAVPAPARGASSRAATSRAATRRPTSRRAGTGDTPKPPKRRRAAGDAVFVVHGRNTQLNKALFAFLRAVGLKPIEWIQAIKLTGKPSPHVDEVVDTLFKEAAAVVVLFSPDDEVRLRKQYRRANESTYETQLTPQARPNVLFEAGMAMGKNPDRTVLVQVGDVRPFSDIAGRHMLFLSNSVESRQEFATKLENAGCRVDLTGNAWMSEGDFSP